MFISIMVYVLADAALPHLLHRRRRVLPLPATHAPIASGWSNSCRVGYLDQRVLFTAHDFCGLGINQIAYPAKCESFDHRLIEKIERETELDLTCFIERANLLR